MKKLRLCYVKCFYDAKCLSFLLAEAAKSLSKNCITQDSRGLALKPNSKVRNAHTLSKTSSCMLHLLLGYHPKGDAMVKPNNFFLIKYLQID